MQCGQPQDWGRFLGRLERMTSFFRWDLEKPECINWIKCISAFGLFAVLCGALQCFAGTKAQLLLQSPDLTVTLTTSDDLWRPPIHPLGSAPASPAAPADAAGQTSEEGRESPSAIPVRAPRTSKAGDRLVFGEAVHQLQKVHVSKFIQPMNIDIEWYRY